MTEAGQEPLEIPVDPPDSIGVAVIEGGSSKQSEKWERTIREAIETKGYKTHSRFFHGRGAAAGGPDQIESIFQIMRYTFEAGGALSLINALAQKVRHQYYHRQDLHAVGTKESAPLLFVQLSHGIPLEETGPPPLTTRDLVRVLPVVREALKEHGKYLVDVEGNTCAGGFLCVYWLEPSDLKGKILRRLTDLAEEAQVRSDHTSLTAVTLRNIFWKPPWNQ